MASVRFRNEDYIALILAAAVHAGVLALLMLRPAAALPPLPDRMEVTIADDVGPQSSAPTPHTKADADIAPTLGTQQPAPAPIPAPAPKPIPMPRAIPAPPPPRVTPDKPAPVKPAKAKPVESKPAPKPVPAKVEPTPPRAVPSARAKPQADPIATAIATANAKAKPAKPAKAAKLVADPVADAVASTAPHRKNQPDGGSRIGAAFSKAFSNANTLGKSTAAPADTAGPEVKAALGGAISRQLKPHWTAPQGVDVDQLVTILSFDLNPDGTLAGRPVVVSQTGITDSNRPQAARHAEQAIRAVELAQPFALPPEYYDAWRHIPRARFDRNLSQ